MEPENYYQKNNETGKLNIFTTKAFYDQLGTEQKKVFKRFCLWSHHQECWVSKGKAEHCGYLKDRLKELGFEDKGNTGERLSFEEQVRQQQEKAEHRADRAENRAEKAEQKYEQLHDQAKKMASAIPFGQPILVGHHSEKRDRKYRERIHNTFGKAFEELDKSNYYSDKAATARETAEGKKYTNPVYLGNRIKECEKNIRILERRLLGKLYPNSPEREISQESRDFYNSRIKEEKEKLEFYQDRMKVINPEWSGSITVTTKKVKGKSKGM